jgi:tRNA 2-selenouridine synthase
MAVQKIDITTFLELSEKHPVLDVRSPSEYAHAHIPNAISFPLFTDQERKVVGTAYKQESRENAIKIGLEYFGPRMRQIVEEVEALTSKTILVHCWRGGMRSGAIAWLLDLYGFTVYSLAGGYKAYRNWIINQFEEKRNLKIVGGYTGSAKTLLLHKLEKDGHSIIDLEALANHKGSALGGIGLPPQPSQEMFENILGTELFKKQGKEPIFIEDESQRIGNTLVPNPFYSQMKASTVYFLDIPFEARLTYLVEEYGVLPKDKLADSIHRIQKRLGGLETNNALTFIEENNFKECFRILLTYYDRWYLKGSKKKISLVKIPSETIDTDINSTLLLNAL